MVSAWYMDDSDGDQRSEHKPDPTVYISPDELYKMVGVEYFKINADNFENDETLQNLRKKRGYTYEDEVNITEEGLPNYHEKLKHFFTEHLHSDEEIRLCMEGSGYFDVRDKNDKWIRIKLEKNDFIVLPAGIYHRFTLDDKNYIKAKRYFQGEPVWTPINRPADEHPSRKQYLKSTEQ